MPAAEKLGRKRDETLPPTKDQTRDADSLGELPLGVVSQSVFRQQYGKVFTIINNPYTVCNLLRVQTRFLQKRKNQSL